MAGVWSSARSPNRRRSCKMTLRAEGAASRSAGRGRVGGGGGGGSGGGVVAGGNDGSWGRQRDVVKTQPRTALVLLACEAFVAEARK